MSFEESGGPPKPPSDGEPDGGDPPAARDATAGGTWTAPDIDAVPEIERASGGGAEPGGGVEPDEGSPAIIVEDELGGFAPPPVDGEPVGPLVASAPDGPPPEFIPWSAPGFAGDPADPGAFATPVHSAVACASDPWPPLPCAPEVRPMSLE